MITEQLQLIDFLLERSETKNPFASSVARLSKGFCKRACELYKMINCCEVIIFSLENRFHTHIISFITRRQALIFVVYTSVIKLSANFFKLSAKILH